MPLPLDLEGEEVPTLLEVVSLMALKLKGQEMPTYAKTVDGSDSNALA
jgi:hypothetical protein